MKNDYLKMQLPNAYSGGKVSLHFAVDWSGEDDIYVAYVGEFPSLATHGTTWQKAIEEMVHVVSAILEDEQAE